MRIPFRALFAAGAFACLAPIVARSQTDTALKLSTTVPQAASEFKAGVVDWENFSFESASSHFQAASTSDPNLGLARAMHAFIGGSIVGELAQPSRVGGVDVVERQVGKLCECRLVE